MSSHRPPDPAPQNWVADRFEIRELIGSGGLGDVYRALDHHLNRAVAIKRVRMQVNQNDRRLVEQTWREAMTTACLQHPNIVTIFDYGIDAQGAYVVMELIEGETLEDVLVRGPLQFEDFLRFAQQSLEAIVAAHALGLIHRDLKPGNFMIARASSRRAVPGQDSRFRPGQIPRRAAAPVDRPFQLAHGLDPLHGAGAIPAPADRPPHRSLFARLHFLRGGHRPSRLRRRKRLRADRRASEKTALPDEAIAARHLAAARALDRRLLEKDPPSARPTPPRRCAPCRHSPSAATIPSAPPAASSRIDPAPAKQRIAR